MLFRDGEVDVTLELLGVTPNLQAILASASLTEGRGYEYLSIFQSCCIPDPLISSEHYVVTCDE